MFQKPWCLWLNFWHSLASFILGKGPLNDTSLCKLFWSVPCFFSNIEKKPEMNKKLNKSVSVCLSILCFFGFRSHLYKRVCPSIGRSVGPLSFSNMEKKWIKSWRGESRGRGEEGGGEGKGAVEGEGERERRGWKVSIRGCVRPPVRRSVCRSPVFFEQRIWMFFVLEWLYLIKEYCVSKF